MAEVSAGEERFRRWHGSSRAGSAAKPFSHGTVFRSERHPDYWELNCVQAARVVERNPQMMAPSRHLLAVAPRPS